MIEFFKHVFTKDFMEWLLANYRTSIYLVLFLIIFVETGLVIMPFLPGDSLLFIAGLTARSGQLDLVTLIGLLVVAAILGDNLNYFIGKNIGLRVLHLKIKGRALVKQAYLDRAHEFYEKNGAKTIIMARFVPIVRTFAPFVAGIAEMSYKTFLMFDILGGILWIGSLSCAGYLLGNIDIIRNHIELVAVGIIALSVLPMVIGILKGSKQA